MILIVKRQNQQKYYLVRLSKLSSYGTRLTDLTNDESLDKKFIRTQLYQFVINKLIAENRWNRPVQNFSNVVTNTKHEWIVKWFMETNEKFIFIEVDNSVFQNLT